MKYKYKRKMPILYLPLLESEGQECSFKNVLLVFQASIGKNTQRSSYKNMPPLFNACSLGGRTMNI
jgi:hypothetical protein